MYTLLNPRDQIEFPNTAFELPGAKRHECSEEQNREGARHGQEEPRVTTAPGAAAAPTAAGASAIAGASTTTGVSAITGVSAVARVVTATRLPTAAAVPTAATVPTAAAFAAPAVSTGATPGHGIGVRRRHGMLCMFCIDSGIIL
jgi:hypothetical protein